MLCNIPHMYITVYDIIYIGPPFTNLLLQCVTAEAQKTNMKAKVSTCQLCTGVALISMSLGGQSDRDKNN